MRKLTTTQLEAELQVGTVDMSEVELVLPLDQSIDEFLAVAEHPEFVGRRTVRGSRGLAEIAAVLALKAAEAIATKIPDTRAALAVADADAAATSSVE